MVMPKFGFRIEKPPGLFRWESLNQEGTNQGAAQTRRRNAPSHLCIDGQFLQRRHSFDFRSYQLPSLFK